MLVYNSTVFFGNGSSKFASPQLSISNRDYHKKRTGDIDIPTTVAIFR